MFVLVPMTSITRPYTNRSPESVLGSPTPGSGGAFWSTGAVRAWTKYEITTRPVVAVAPLRSLSSKISIWYQSKEAKGYSQAS